MNRNRLLSVLSSQIRDGFAARAVKRTLPLKTALFLERETPKLAYFPLSGVASIVAVGSDGGVSEVGFMGREGVSGAYHLLGPAKVPTRCFVQIEGEFLAVPFAAVRRAYDTSEEFRRYLLEFVQADSLAVSQIAGCNQMHKLDMRLARWLLMAYDRHESHRLRVTHEILAEMVASSRSTVTQVLLRLKRKGLIEYSRGQLVILDREGLEAAACDCYPIAKSLFSNLYHAQ